jgi:hypothetical protein
LARQATSSRRDIPDFLPLSAIRPPTALVSSLCQAAVTKSGSVSMDNRGPRRVSARRSAAGVAGSTSATGVRRRTQPCGCVSTENHTTAGNTVDPWQYLPTRSTCSTPFCNAKTVVLSSHNRASHAAAAGVWVSLTASNTTSTGSVMVSGSVRTGPGTTNEFPSSLLTSMESRGVRPQTTT